MSCLHMLQNFITLHRILTRYFIYLFIILADGACDKRKKTCKFLLRTLKPQMVPQPTRHKASVLPPHQQKMYLGALKR